MTSHDVGITGCGMVTALGPDVATTWRRLLAGDSGIRPFTRHEGIPAHQAFAGHVSTVGPPQDRHDRYTQLALLAAQEALADAGWTLPLPPTLRIGIVIGSSLFCMDSLTEAAQRTATLGLASFMPRTLPMIMNHSAAATMGQWCGATGPTLMVSTGCASGVDAIGLARQLVQSGGLDLALTGGTEAPLGALPFAAFLSVRALASWRGTPEEASRPCDAQRTGIVLSEGASMCVIERTSVAKARGHAIQAGIRGYASNTDRQHGMQSSSASIADCVHLALQDARLSARDIDAVSLHATGTRGGDPLEAGAIRSVFGPDADRLPAVALKAALGHTIGACGAIETSLAVQALHHQCLPPTRNWHTPDPMCLQGLSIAPRHLPLRRILKVSIGLGGQNACLVLEQGASV